MAVTTYTANVLDVTNPVYHWLCGGSNSINKTITDAGVVGEYQVTLHHQRTRVLIDQVWSDEDGNYSFDGLNDDYFYVVGIDHRVNPQKADISSYVQAE